MYTTATINWPVVDDVCSDFDCPCGDSTHHCTFDGAGSAKHFRCSGCRQAYAIDDKVRLLTEEVHCGRTGPRANQYNPDALREGLTIFMQWKGTTIDMTVDCLCGQQFRVNQDFAYEPECPHCRRKYHTDWHIAVHPVAPEDEHKASVIHEHPEDDE